MTPHRQIRAAHTATAITVYQAYPATIADAAVEAQRFVAPFDRHRMTWIKPSFLWMAYRSGWATKPDQERVLAIEITRTGFEWALEHSSLSYHDPTTYADHDAWLDRKNHSPVRVQWDPERDLHLQPLTHRSIQVGLSSLAVEHYVDDWILTITDITNLCHNVRDLVEVERIDAATLMLPTETPYPLTPHLVTTIGASTEPSAT